MVNTQGLDKKLKFSYESDTAASFLVIQYDAKVAEYQLRMLERNRVKYVISPEMVIKEGIACFYYNITSMISLAFFLERQKLSREEFLRLLLYISSSVNDSLGYLLDPESFIFNMEYIYINPETFEPALVYIPAKIEQSGWVTLQGFTSDLLMMHIQAEGFDSGNFVQRILSVAKSEAFNLKACVALMSELLYGSGQDRGQAWHDEPGKEEPRKIERPTENNYIKVKKEEIKQEKEKENEKNVNKNDSKSIGANINAYLVVVLVIALQFAMGTIIYMSREFLEKVGENQTVTYAAVLMIVLAVDVLIFKRIYDARLINVKQIKAKADIEMQGSKSGEFDAGANVTGSRKGDKSAGSSSKSADAGYRREYTDGWSLDKAIRRAAEDRRSTGAIGEVLAAKDKESGSLVADTITAVADGSGRASGGRACKTELLGKDAKGIRTLRCTGKHGSDEDIVLDKDDFVIGRLAGHVDHVINNNAVGKLHAQFICKNGACFVKDLNSMNGTFINNTRIESNKEYELRDNDRLRLANCEYVLVYG